MNLSNINKENVFVKSTVDNAKDKQENCCAMAQTPNGDVFVLCDSVDGNIGGDKASGIAVNSIIEYFNRCEYDNVPQAINDAIRYANEQIISYASENHSNDGMTTTVCLLLLQEKNAFIAHVGDSRIYLYLRKENELHLLTKDHSYVQTLVDTGEMTDEDADYYSRKSIVLNALGKYHEVTPTIDMLQPKNDDVFLICNAVFKRMVWNGTVKKTLAQNISLEQKGERLLELATQDKDQENCKLQLIKIDNSPWNKSEFTSYNTKKHDDKEPSPEPKNEQTNNSADDKPKSIFSIEKILYIVVPLLIILSCIIFINRDKDEKELSTTIEKTDDTLTQSDITLHDNIDHENKLTSVSKPETKAVDSPPQAKTEVKQESKIVSNPYTLYTKNTPFGVTKIIETGTEYEISYKVKTGDNISRICQLFACSASDFRKWNNLKNDNIGAGMVYLIKNDKASIECKIHTVKKNEILVNIAKRNKVKMDDVIVCNGLKNPNSIAPGQKLILIVK